MSLTIYDWPKIKGLAEVAKVKQKNGMELTPEEAAALEKYSEIDGRSVTSRQNGLSGGAKPIDFKALATKYQQERGQVLTRPEGFWEYHDNRWWPATEKDLRNGIAEFLQEGQTREVGGEFKSIPCNRANIDGVFTNLQSRNGYGHEPPCWLSGGETRRGAGLMLSMGNGLLDVGLAALALVHEMGPILWCGETFALQDEAWQEARMGQWEEAAKLAALRPHTPDLFTPYWLPYDFEPTATCPMWEEAVAYLLPDHEVYRDFQMLCGYCFVVARALQACGFLCGPDGTGKTLMATVLYCALTGSYPELGVTRHSGPGNRANVCKRPLPDWQNRFALKELSRALANIVRDNPSRDEGWGGWEKVEGKFLDGTGGGGTVTAETKYEADIPERGFTAFNLFCGNWMPSFMLTHPQLRARLRLIPCNVKVRGTAKDNPDLAKAIYIDELEGVFNWCLRGLGMLMKSGAQLPQSAAGAAEIDRLRIRQDPKHGAALWVRECLAPSADGGLVVEDVFCKYEETMRAEGCATLRLADFKAAVMGAFGVECSSPQRKGWRRQQTFMGLGWRVAPTPAPSSPPPSPPPAQTAPMAGA